MKVLKDGESFISKDGVKVTYHGEKTVIGKMSCTEGCDYGCSFCSYGLMDIEYVVQPKFILGLKISERNREGREISVSFEKNNNDSFLLLVEALGIAIKNAYGSNASVRIMMEAQWRIAKAILQIID
ncbi:MAG: hypothetical protein AAB630_01495 [Patescibacteria group bacterium]